MRARLKRWYDRLIAFCAFADPADEAKHFGLGHVVVLLSLGPAIVAMSLYLLAVPHRSPSQYQTDLGRFLNDTAPVKPHAVDKDDLVAMSADDCAQACNSVQSELAPEYAAWKTAVGRQDSELRELTISSGLFNVRLPPERVFIDLSAAFNRYALDSWQAADADFQDYALTATATRTSPVESIDSIGGILSDKLDAPFTDGQFALLLLAMLLYPVCAIECVRRRQFFLLVAGLAIPNYFAIGLLVEAVGIGVSGEFLNRVLPLYILPKLPLLWLALRGRLLARPVIGTLALLALVSVILTLPDKTWPITFVLLGIGVPTGFGVNRGLAALRRSPGWSARKILALAGLALLALFVALLALFWLVAIVDYNLFGTALRGLLPVVLFVLTLAVVRMVVLAIQTNAYFLRNLGLRRFAGVTAHSVVLWLPMLVLAAPYFILTEHVIPMKTTDALFEEGLLPYAYDGQANFRDNALQGSALQFDRAIFTFHVATERLKAQVRYESNEVLANGLARRTMREFDNIVPAEFTMTPITTGAFLGAVKKGGTLVQENVQDGYRAMRAKAKTKLAESIAGLDAKVNATVAEKREEIIDAIDEKKKEAIAEARDANDQAQSAIWTTMAYIQAVHQIGLLLFFLICIKSFLYVFARVAFHRERGTVITLGESEGEVRDLGVSRITPTGTQYLIDDTVAQTMFVSRRFQCRGKPPRFAIPQPFRAPIARLLHRATTMNRVEVTPGTGTVSCTAARGAQFVEWDLREGETVIFDFHNFVAMSQSVQLSTLISLRLTTLLLGKFIFSEATGPGRLVLMTDGRAEITGAAGIAESLPPERLVAMHKDTRLNVESELNVIDVYLSAAYVRPAAGAPVIVDVDSQRGAGSGLGQFLLHFVWPG